MSVTIKGSMEFLKPGQVLYSNPQAIEVLANEIVSSMAEASIDMILDGGPSEYPSKQSIENCLMGLPDMGIDFVRDAIRELEEKLIARLQTMQVKPTVKAIHFDDTGYSDVEVDVECV
jgi:hypothetical protein